VNHESEFRNIPSEVSLPHCASQNPRRSKFNPEFALGSFTCRDEQMPFEFRWRIPLGQPS